MGLSNLKARVFSRTGGYRTIFSAGVRTLSQSRCSCRPTPGARMLFVFYPGFRRRGLRLRLRPPRSRLHPGLLAATRSAGSKISCALRAQPEYYFVTRTSSLPLAGCRPLATLGALVIFSRVPKAYALGYGAAVPERDSEFPAPAGRS